VVQLTSNVKGGGGGGRDVVLQYIGGMCSDGIHVEAIWNSVLVMVFDVYCITLYYIAFFDNLSSN
jgi:hypothetical protein